MQHADGIRCSSKHPSIKVARAAQIWQVVKYTDGVAAAGVEDGAPWFNTLWDGTKGSTSSG